MPNRADELFDQLQNSAAILALIGQPEDTHLDCKEWPQKEDDAQKFLAKAVSGLANADGGVLVIGMKASSTSKDEPDVITGPAPVGDTSPVVSRVLTLIGQTVEPGIVGLQTREVAQSEGSRSGFVIIYVPKSDGPPKRSRKDWKFYQRIGSTTLPMDYWQIEDQFGNRPHPRLELYLEQSDKGPHDTRTPERSLVLGLTNSGRGIAKFPGIRFPRMRDLTVDSSGIDGDLNFGLRLRPTDKEQIIFGGGADDVIYPGQTLKIAKLRQTGKDMGIQGIPTTHTPIVNNRIIMARYVFKSLAFTCEIYCEGCETKRIEQNIAEDDFIVKT